MCRVVDTYRAGSEEAGRANALTPAQLEATLSDVCRAGRAAHPGLCLADVAFVAHLARCGAPVAAATTGLHAGDLFLACAALEGDAGALRELRRKHRPVVARYLRGIDVSGPFLEEVEQRLWTDLLVSRPGRHPKLASYTGAGPLAGFVGVSAQRIALGIRRSQSVEARAVVGALESHGGLQVDQELVFIKRRFHGAFQRAVEEALRVLTDRELAVFRMHFVDGMTTGRIARVYKVSQPTVSRWLVRARRRVLAEARGLLRTRLKVTDSEFESIAGLLISQLDLNVSRCLAAR